MLGVDDYFEEVDDYFDQFTRSILAEGTLEPIHSSLFYYIGSELHNRGDGSDERSEVTLGDTPR
jgi:hypothetical protein